MISFHGVDKTIPSGKGHEHVLRDFSGFLPAGRIGILGESGPGKSALLKLISGRSRPDSGFLQRSGRFSWPLGYWGGFHKTMSGAENVQFIARTYGEDSEAVMDFVMDFAELGQQFYSPMASYSPVMRSKLAFGLSFAIPFDCYVVEEAVATGDAQFRTKCLSALKERLSQSSIVMVAQSMPIMQQFCTTGAVLADGDIVLYPNLSDALAAHQHATSARAASARGAIPS